MLYHTARFTPLKLIRTAATRLAGAIAASKRTAADTTLFDGLSAHQLRDLGLRRHEDPHFHETYYR
jgi:hypothetical protein